MNFLLSCLFLLVSWTPTVGCAPRSNFSVSQIRLDFTVTLWIPVVHPKFTLIYPDLPLSNLIYSARWLDLSRGVSGIAVALKIVCQFWPTALNDATLCQNVHKVWLELLKHAAVMGNYQHAQI